MSNKSKFITLKSAPKATPTRDNFEIKEHDLPELIEGQVLLRPIYLSVDPHMRGKMSGTSTHIKPYEIGKPLYGDGYAEVIDAKNCKKLQRGDFVTGSEIPWSECCVLDENDVIKRDKQMDPEALLSICGMTGLTAYFGLVEVGRLKEGDTVLVSGAAGAVGTAVCQLAKIKNCRVIGIVGSDDKVKYIKNQVGFDDGINYKTVDSIESAIKNISSDINLYWDNVGGDTLDSAVNCLSNFGRVVNCGYITYYNEENPPKGKRLEGLMVSKRLKMQGFIVYDYLELHEEVRQKLYKWFEEGLLKKQVTIHEGLENMPDSFLGLFQGVNKGKLLVKVGDIKERK
jgi:hypothetical protein